MIDLNLISPEIFISLSLMFLLIVGVYKKNSSSFKLQTTYGAQQFPGYTSSFTDG